MKLDYAFLADSAEIRDGQVSVLGGNIDTISSGSFPLVRPAVALVTRIILPPEECNQPHDVHAFFSDPSGRSIEPEVRGRFTARPHPRHPERGGSLAAVYSFYQMTFPVPGIYQGHIVVNSKELGVVDLELVALDR